MNALLHKRLRAKTQVSPAHIIICKTNEVDKKKTEPQNDTSCLEMSDVVSAPPPSQDRPLVRRRKSISTSIVLVPTKLTVLPHQSSSSTATSSSDDLELISIRPNSHSYTSLKDLLPSAAVNSPKPNALHQAQPGSDICIRNRLVKQAAWAYLQPMSTSPGTVGGSLFHSLWPRVAAFFDFARDKVIWALNWILRVIRSSR